MSETPLEKKWKVAIIGSGPAAFYAASGLLKNKNLDFQVDMIEKLPTPYGLVRGGVAPDHQKIKSVMKIYERTALKENFRYFGNVTLGQDVQKEDLLKIYDAVIYATGCPTDRKLNIPGEDFLGSHTATAFVGWYNGHPDFQDLEFDLSAKRVAIIGIGNVAMDVARILAMTPEELEQSDICQHALEALSKSKIEEIFVIARRGPVQAAFTPIEAREMTHLKETRAYTSPEDLELEEASKEQLEHSHHDIHKNYEILQEMSKSSLGEKKKTVHFLFKRSPTEIHGENSKVSGIRLNKNKLEDKNGRIAALSTEDFETLDVQLVFRSIGYFGIPIPGISYDSKTGLIPNEIGRVLDEEKTVLEGEYVAGWAKRGASGVIGTNKHDAVETVHCLIEDIEKGKNLKSSTEDLKDFLQSQGVDYVTFEDWKILDQFEQEKGELLSKPREKVTRVAEMMKIIREGRTQS